MPLPTPVEGCSSKDVWRNRSRPSRPFSLRQSGFACSCALCEVAKVFRPMKLRVFVDDITAFMNGRSKVLVEVAEKALKKRERGRGEWLEVIGHRRRDRRKEQGDHFMQVSGGEVSGIQQERSCYGDEC